MWLKRTILHVIVKAPHEVAECEFDCRIAECLYGDWKTCERRISYKKEQRDFLSKAALTGHTIEKTEA
jgi:hypothetical protein